MSRFESVPGQYIVKLKGGEPKAAPARIRAREGKVVSPSATLQNFLTTHGLQEAEQLMTLTGARVVATPAKGFYGAPVMDADLSSLYLLRFKPKADLNEYEMLEQLRALDDVEYAEPNYIVHVCADPSQYSTDPLYSQQWGPAAIGLDKLWEVQPLTGKRPVIAILDTGVDISHPDLVDNIWTNPMEADGADNRDDDANGFKDDIHGWDFVNQSGKMRDNNGHGTHCAGIAAAVGGNGIGITGANPDALIMPIAVLQSNGTGDVATIIKGLDYAAANGADVISMSFGTYSDSKAMGDALGKAYQKAVLVAAAGNDFLCIYRHFCDINKKSAEMNMPMFPGAYSFVLGVQASADARGNLAGFSNFDHDGPVTSAYSDLYNYELRAPGTGIISTFPGGQYRALNGTSMACPLAAGAISRLMAVKDITSKEELFGDLIHTAKGNIDIFGAYSLTDADRKPTLSLVTYRLDDEKMGDGDGRPDAGETIRIYPTFRNAWGNARNIKYRVRLSETEDPDILEFIDNGDAHSISNLSSYASAEAENPFILKISPECVDGRIICLELVATCDNISKELVQPIEFTVENGVELSGIISEDMTLTPDKNYFITTNIVIPKGITLTILPGTKLNFKSNSSIKANGDVIAIGNQKSRICFNNTFNGNFFKYFEIVDLNSSNCSCFNFCEFNNCCAALYINPLNKFDSQYEIKDCIFRNCGSLVNTNNCQDGKASISSSTIINSFLPNGKLYAISDKCNYSVRNKNDILLIYDLTKWWPNNLLAPLQQDYSIFDSNSIIYLGPQYFGSSREDIVRKNLYDILQNYGFAQFDLSNMLTRPVHEAHGIVWKVVVNGYDAQDEYEWLAPLGVGKHKFEVYFNRKMNHEKAPFIAMGVREPYTQTAIAEDGSWRTENFDGDEVDIYTSYLTIQGKDNYDGVNTIYVSDAEDDEYFEIPIEDVRFHVNVQSAGSMSNGFEAEAGVGKVTLTWENPEENFDDMLGYNMYRYTLDAEGQPTEAKRINETLLTEESLIDYDIVPGTTYCYYYKVLRTSLDENAASKIVAATPRAAGKGDANGSGDVDVADVVTEVNYMVGREPKPFIFDAADVNDDTEVDILDVVGTVNLILKADAPQTAAVQSMASYWVEGGKVYVDSPVDLGGVQFELSGNQATTEVKVLDALKGMESTGDWVTPELYRFLAFSMSGKTIGAGKHALLEIGDAEITGVKLSDPDGHNVVPMLAQNTGISSVIGQQMLVPSPNPFDAELNVPLMTGLYSGGEVTLTLTGLGGAEVLSKTVSTEYGRGNVTLDTRAVPAGFYLLTLTVDGHPVQTAKVIKR